MEAKDLIKSTVAHKTSALSKQYNYDQQCKYACVKAIYAAAAWAE